MHFLGVEESFYRPAKADGDGYVLRRDSYDVLRGAFDFEMFGRKGRGNRQ